MATYRLSVQTLSRSAGRSSVAAAAYRAGERLTDARTGRVHDFTRRRAGILSTHLVGWQGTRAELWDAAEAADTRKNSRTAREVQVSLPAELPPVAREALAVALAGHLSERYGVAVDLALHRPSRRGDARNWHAHLLLTTRRVESGALTAKTRELDDATTGPQEVEAMRELWAAGVNEALQLFGVEDRVDHRSHARRGREQESTHVARAVVAVEQRREPLHWKPIGRAAARRNALIEARDAARAYGASVYRVAPDLSERPRRPAAGAKSPERLHPALQPPPTPQEAAERRRAALRAALRDGSGSIPNRPAMLPPEATQEIRPDVRTRMLTGEPDPAVTLPPVESYAQRIRRQMDERAREIAARRAAQAPDRRQGPRRG